jgi:hypothetical protein
MCYFALFTDFYPFSSPSSSSAEAPQKLREDVEKEIEEIWKERVEEEKKKREEKERWAEEVVRQLEKERKVCISHLHLLFWLLMTPNYLSCELNSRTSAAH